MPMTCLVKTMSGSADIIRSVLTEIHSMTKWRCLNGDGNVTVLDVTDMIDLLMNNNWYPVSHHQEHVFWWCDLLKCQKIGHFSVKNFDTLHFLRLERLTRLFLHLKFALPKVGVSIPHNLEAKPWVILNWNKIIDVNKKVLKIYQPNDVSQQERHTSWRSCLARDTRAKGNARNHKDDGWW